MHIALVIVPKLFATFMVMNMFQNIYDQFKNIQGQFRS